MLEINSFSSPSITAHVDAERSTEAMPGHDREAKAGDGNEAKAGNTRPHESYMKRLTGGIIFCRTKMSKQYFLQQAGFTNYC